jgi:hypothetical protein
MDTLKLRAGTESGQREQVVPDPPYAVTSPGLASNRYRGLLMLGVMALVCMVVARGIRKGEFDFNADEAQHAVTGLFIADAMHDLPVRHPAQYAYRYYAQYPAIAIVHWPPLFYVFEGLSFLTLGRSVIAARVTVLLFAVLLCYQWFKLVEELQDPFTAAVSTAMLALLPTILLFEKTVMLEIPSLALAVASIRAWIQYLGEGRRVSIYRFALWLSAAMMCKQNSVYILVFCVLSLMATKRWERVWNRDAFIAAGLFTILVGPFYLLMLVSNGPSVAKDLGSHQLSGLQRLAYYWTVLPATLSILILGLSILGLVMSYRWNNKGQTPLMVSWILAGYLTFTFFGQSEARFAIYWLPPLVYFAAGLLIKGFRTPLLQISMRALAPAIVALMAVHAWGYERPYIAGYEATAARLVTTYRSGIVLFDGKVPGNFVFFMRALDPRRQFLVLRKSLYISDVRKNQYREELLHGREGLQNLFRNDGIRFVVASDSTALDFESEVSLRECLRSDQFRLLGRFPIQSNEPGWQNASLLLYENKQWAPPTDSVLRLRMLTLNHDIVVPMGSFDFVEKQSPATRTGTQ